MQAVFGAGHNMQRFYVALEQEDADESVPLRDFQEQLKAAFPPFETLHTLAVGQ